MRPSEKILATPLGKGSTYRGGVGVNLNYRSRALAKGLPGTIFCDKLFSSVFYC